jgi:hypothetical protein
MESRKLRKPILVIPGEHPDSVEGIPRTPIPLVTEIIRFIGPDGYGRVPALGISCLDLSL